MTDEPTNPTEVAIKREVINRGWQFSWLSPDRKLYLITTNRGETSIGQGSRLERSSANGRSIAKNKRYSYEYLERLGYQTPGFLVPDIVEDAIHFLDRYKTVVVKPIDMEQSKGVTVGITNSSELIAAMESARRISGGGQIVLQEQLEGKLYRLLVVGDRLFAAALRLPPSVVGDGEHTVRELVNTLNQDSRRDGVGAPMKKINIDSVAAYLGAQQIDQVLAKGEQMNVLEIASVSVGGESRDVTNEVSSYYVNKVTEITTGLGLSVCGFDIIVDDITIPPEHDMFPVVELNSMPGFKLHLFPTLGGEPRDPSAAVLDYEFGID